MTRRLLVLGDSLAFHGPAQAELLTHPGLFPNVLARLVDAEVDTIARLGWTTRDGWWALTKDPYVYSVLLPRADAVVLALGGSDTLPVSLPPYLRDGIAYLHPEPVRRVARRAYHFAHPHLVRALRGRRTALPVGRSMDYLTRCVEGIRYFHPALPVVTMDIGPYTSAHHGAGGDNLAFNAALHAWGRAHAVPVAAVHPIVAPLLAAGDANPDGMHYSWTAHERIGAALAALVADAWGARAP